MKYTVEYVELDSGEKPFEEFLSHFSVKDKAKIFETINYFLELKNQGLPIKEKLSRYLENGIFELRIYLGGVIVSFMVIYHFVIYEFTILYVLRLYYYTPLTNKTARTLYFYQKGRKVVIIHGFIKKTVKTPRKEIEKAKLLREKYSKR